MQYSEQAEYRQGGTIDRVAMRADTLPISECELP